jgi:hypothetical protein
VKVSMCTNKKITEFQELAAYRSEAFTKIVGRT